MSETLMTMRQALYETLKGELAARPELVLLGEDIRDYGGAFAVTRDLWKLYPERVLNTPISEGGFVGVAVGASMAGLRVVAELMFMDFMTLAMDQLVNHASKIPYMYAGQARVPMVLRAPFGGRRGYGPSHSQSLESWLMSVPGLKVVVPSGARSAAGLLRSAIADDGPVVFLEHKLLYDAKEGVKAEALAEEERVLGRGQVLREGSDVTVVTYGYGTRLALSAAEALSGEGLEVEVVDLLTLKPWDRALVFESVRKTGKAVFVEEGVRTGGVGGEVIAEVAEECLDVLDGGLVRVGAADLPIPASRAAEDVVLPGVGDVVAGVRKALML
jgi:pyruvate/2-oxoglutarate/acetoin dehydrogenase E1 component